ncbi:MAG: hypothetical protein BME93_04995 [Methanosarcinales archaeon Met12]|nr:MAG: hypothetical protein BME93_04995 [Methanosarcinales archaeon Met12]
MEQKFYEMLIKMLEKGQLSISGITRQFKKQGYDQHRLIITGYLRALRDLEHVMEKDIPPSKVYSLAHSSPSSSKYYKDIYALVGERIAKLDPDRRFAVGVYVLSTLFHRPCFKHELKLAGLPPMTTEWTRECDKSNLKEYRQAVKRINIPSDDPAYEFVDKKNNPITEIGAEVLCGITREVMDLDGLYIKYQQMKLG